MWLYFPTSRSVAVVADSTGECAPLSSEQATILAAFCTASGKHSPPRTWSQRWMRGGWMRRLSGVTAQRSPEESASTYGAWLDGILSASSAGSHASHSAAPESDREPKTSAGSGPRSSSSSSIAEWDGACWKTFGDLFGMGSPLSPGIFPRSGGVSNGRLYERPTLERHTGASGCSSSGTWDRNEYPTPSATPYGSSPNEGQISHKRATVETWAGSWSTPRANDAEKRGDVSNDPRHGLVGQSAHWSTPRASDGARGGGDRDRQVGPSLRAQVRGEWPTPRAAHGAGQSDDLRGGRSLDVIATSAHWPTATVGDSRASGGRNECENANNGTTLSDLVRGRGRLNWRFVAWLMGWRWLIGDTPRPWPPGPDDADAWAEVLEERPDLEPATAEPEPDRAAMLRLLGNGVVPEQAEAAIGALLRRT